MPRRAFTLVELLVVIAIIGLLSTVAVVATTSTRSKARDTKRIADIKQIMTAMYLYRENNPAGTYPNPTALGCAASTGGYYCLGQTDSQTCWASSEFHGCDLLNSALSSYIAKIPDDPENVTGKHGDAYLYLFSGSNSGVTAPFLHWGMDQQTSANICMGGASGQWNADGRNRWWCITALPN
jgi:prepilin-type N-terminal cleavage/methylation domain-containing protein